MYDDTFTQVLRDICLVVGALTICAWLLLMTAGAIIGAHQARRVREADRKLELERGRQKRLTRSRWN